MALPNFWTQITVSSIIDAEVLNRIFQLHAHKPLDITLDFPNPIPVNASLRFWKIILTVARQMDRCRRLSIRTAGFNYQLIYKAFLNPSYAPHLEYLELIRTDRDPSISASFPSVKFDPNVLSRVHISGILWETAMHTPAGAYQLHLKDTDAAWLGVPRGMSVQALIISYTPIGWSTALRLDTSALLSLKVEGDQSISLFSHQMAFKTLENIEFTSLSDYAWSGLVTLFRRSSGMFGAVKLLRLSRMPYDIELIDARFLDAFPALEHLDFNAPGRQPNGEFLEYYKRLTESISRITFNGADVLELHRIAVSTNSRA
ncbi:hypothetical protein APHAL10511_000316 [Amanita phalloides]|nr:hypothetical protein APHAL10511_000316 [Amanita phalloides]